SRVKNAIWLMRATMSTFGLTPMSSAPMDYQNRNRRLPLAARSEDRARPAQCGHRRKRQRQIEPLSRTETAGGRRARPGRPIARGRRWSAFYTLGRPRNDRALGQERRALAPRHGSKSTDKPAAWLCGE